jgi:CheY-like chemotaxis protein/nitrogen-specific signal transduction histidine kinase
VRSDTGEIVRWMGTCTDIHEQRLVQEELRAVNARKDEFLAMLAHELRNPLAPISTAAEILQLLPDDRESVLRSSALIGRQVRQMTTLVDDLLDASRFTRGMVELRRELTDLKPVVNHALEQAQPIIQARGHSVVVRLCPTPAFVLGDGVRLVQVVTNLLNNAAKYTPVGGLITVELGTQDGIAEVRVSDNGSGIDPELLPHVFALFTQAHRTQDRTQGGLGLGLALVKSIIGLHGGSVSAHSAGSGQGSTFAVRLPLATPGQDAVAEDPPDKGRTARALRVMVVDDNADAAQSLGIWLGTQGHHVAVFTDALSALASARQAPAEAYVLDIGLPVLDGYELARQIRSDAANRDALLIALTGYGQPGDIQRSMDAGFDDHLVKPGDMEKLAGLLAGAG